jgi:hypothetical protein
MDFSDDRNLFGVLFPREGSFVPGKENIKPLLFSILKLSRQGLMDIKNLSDFLYKNKGSRTSK